MGTEAEIVVYTAVLGPHTDPLRPLCCPPAKLQGIRFVCFTDRDEVREAVRWWAGGSPQWNLIWLGDKEICDPRLESRRLKILSHALFPEACCTIWLDAAFQLVSHPRRLLSFMDGAEFMAFRHPWRCRITDEAREIADRGLMPEEQVFAQLRHYQEQGFDTPAQPQQTITSTGLLCRRMSPRVAEFERRWFSEVVARGWRDQMSVDFVLWQMAREGKPLSVCYLPGHYRDNTYAKWYPDRNRKARRSPALRRYTDLQPTGGVRASGTVDEAANSPTG